MHIDHTTLRTKELKLNRDFLIQVFGLTEGARPTVIAAGIAGHWLYDGDKPLIHLIKSAPRFNLSPDLSAEAIDHTAFFLEDYGAFKAKLIALHVPMTLMDLPDIGERRIFLRTPTGILLETVFRDN